jgi:signal transduction histidine kinase/ActR/RegA family two-component response regulator
MLVKFGANFTIPFGYASIVWPATGVILGMYFLFGPSVLIGAFISLVITSFQDPQLSLLPSYILVLWAAISTFQLFLIKYLIVRFYKLPMNINKPVETIRLLLLIGPLASLIFSVVFFIGLWSTVDAELEILLYISTVKWVGEFFGIMFLTPVFLFLYKNKFVRQTKRATAAILTSVFSFILITSIFLLVSNINYKEKQQNFINTTQPFIEQFKITQTKIQHHIKSLDGLFQASLLVSRDEFKQFTQKIRNLNTKINALAWLPYVTHAQRAVFESSLAEQNITDPQIKQLTNSGISVASEQLSYIPIYYIEPMDHNTGAIGLDVSTHPIVSESAIKATQTRSYALTPLLSLISNPDKVTGMIVYYPIFVKNNLGVEEFKGLVEATFEINVLLSEIYEQLGKGRFAYELSYGDNNRFRQINYNVNSIFTYTLDTQMFDKKASLSFASTLELESKLVTWTHLSIMLVGSIIGIVFVMFVFFIVTFNSNLTRKINESTAELIKKNDELEAANQAKNLFLANISHEYRTPLNAIIGFTEIATRETTDLIAKSYLFKIDNASNILLNIVNDVLDLSKMQAGELNLEDIPFQPSVVTTSVVEMLNANAKDKSISLVCEFERSFDRWVEGDELRFKQIIINLLTNAIKFTPTGGVKVCGECIDNEDDTRTLILKVIDTGIGIKVEDQERLFTSFAQAEDSTTRKYGGTGLGLSIVKQLCGLMGGDILLSSEVGKGSEFIVKLTLPKATPIDKVEHVQDNHLTEQHSTEDFSIQNMNVLVVEDNKINQMIVQKQLLSLSVRCDLVDDGQQALDYLDDKIPDLILMDLQMPVMDGFTAAAKIKQDVKLKNIPIVILSASVGKVDRDKAAELYIFDFIYKPFKQADLVKVLNKFAPAIK